MTIVEKGKGREIMNAAGKAKARGGTMIRGRGAGVPQDYYFPIQVEPQKDTVLIVVQKGKINEVKNSIEAMITSETDGVVFTLPVVATSGIFEDRIDEKI